MWVYLHIQKCFGNRTFLKDKKKPTTALASVLNVTRHGCFVLYLSTIHNYKLTLWTSARFIWNEKTSYKSCVDLIINKIIWCQFLCSKNKRNSSVSRTSLIVAISRKLCLQLPVHERWSNCPELWTMPPMYFHICVCMCVCVYLCGCRCACVSFPLLQELPYIS